MFKVGGAMIASGFALAMAMQSALVVAAAPQHSSMSRTLATPAVSRISEGSASPTGSSPTSLGHFYGKATSNLAHITPAGPAHGAVISAFARSSNPSHTKGHHAHTAAPGRAKH